MEGKSNKAFYMIIVFLVIVVIGVISFLFVIPKSEVSFESSNLQVETIDVSNQVADAVQNPVEDIPTINTTANPIEDIYKNPFE